MYKLTCSCSLQLLEKINVQTKTLCVLHNVETLNIFCKGKIQITLLPSMSLFQRCLWWILLYFMWLLISCPAAIADIRDNSRAKTAHATIIATVLEFIPIGSMLVPLTHRRFNQVDWDGNCVPYLTVPTRNSIDGVVVEICISLPLMATIIVMHCELSMFWAGSWQVAMNSSNTMLLAWEFIEHIELHQDSHTRFHFLLICSKQFRVVTKFTKLPLESFYKLQSNNIYI